MAEEVEMTPVSGAEPPKVSTLKLNPVVRPPAVGTAALKPGLKLPPKPGAGALRPGLKLPTQSALRPGLKMPVKPVIHKPGASPVAAPLPKPVGAAAPAAPAAPQADPAVAPISVDAQGVGKLPTVSATAVARDDAKSDVSAVPKPMEALKSVTQKLKGVTQEIPQQAILHKTGIIAEGAVSSAQKEAAKHKTARISLADAMGVAPVKDEGAPMKTIRIRRPVDISAPAATQASPAPEAPAAPQAAPAATVTQRKTLKISRPGTAAVRPGGKFGKRPEAPAASPAEGEVADIPDMPSAPAAPVPMAAPAPEESSFACTLSALVQLAACGVIGALAWFLYQNTQTAYF